MSDKSPIHDPQSPIDDPLAVAAYRWGDFPAVVSPERTLTYGELDRVVTATAWRLRGLGGASGTRIGLYLPNGWRTLVLLLATIRAESVACPLSTRLPPQGAAALLRTVAARVLITDDEGLQEAMSRAVDVVSPAAVVEGGGAAPGGVPPVSMNRPATVVFTSGSTGEPKAALHSLGNHVFNAFGSNANIALEPGDRWLLALPLYHVGGLGVLFRCLLAGAAMVVPGHSLSIGEAAVRYGVTHVSVVATQLRRMLAASAGAGGLKALLVGGSAVPPSLLREAHTRRWPVHTTYGLTEMASQVTTTPPGASVDRLATSGRLLPYRELKLADDGEILVRGATLFLGYVEDGALHRPLDADGWFATRDLGRLGPDGFLHVIGRKDHQFISGGENIQPEEVERVLSALDGIAEAIVVPRPDATFGRRPVAFVRRLAGAPQLAALARLLEPVLPRFKIPDAFYDWPEAAASQGIKVDRRFLKEQAEASEGENRSRKRRSS